MRQQIATFILIAVVPITVFLALNQLVPPSVVPESADPAVFSAARAMNHVRMVTATPHPTGSVANARVRDFLITQLKVIGMDVSVQKTTAALSFGSARGVEVENIIATRKGTGSSKAIMFAAHYDSDPKAPGAGDNGYAVGGILEMLRALKSYSPLKNDIVILFSDGEEAGLFGALAFVQEYPPAKNIGMMFNFDGRGNSGPALMFETTDRNGWLVREFSQAVSHKVAFSIMTDLYKLLPNNTDFTFFKDIIGTGLNFAHIGGVEYYHGVWDDADHLDQRTLQDHGETMLDAALHFGSIDLTDTKASDVVYFTFLWPRFIVYPLSWNIPLVGLATLLFALVLILALRKKHVRPLKLLIGFVLFLLRMLVAGVTVYLLWMYLGPLQPEFHLLYIDTVYHGIWYLTAFIAFALVIGWIFHRFAVTKLGLFNVAFSALFVWLITCWAAALYVPNGSYLFVWPLVFSVGAVAAILMEEDSLEPSMRAKVIVAVCAIPGVYLYSQLIDLFYQGLTLLVAGVLAMLVVFLLGTMQILLNFISQRRQWIEPAVLLLASVVCIAIGLMKRESTEEFPKPDSLVYLLDADSGKARWITFDDKTDGWTQQFFPGKTERVRLSQFFPSSPSGLVTSPAPGSHLTGPTVRIERDITADTVRLLKLDVQSGDNAIQLSFVSDSSNVVYDALVNGKKMVGAEKYIPGISRFVPKRPSRWSLDFHGSHCELEFSIAAHHPFHLRVVARSMGFPQEVARTMPPRPAWTIPRPFYPTDMTIVGKNFVF